MEYNIAVFTILLLKCPLERQRTKVLIKYQRNHQKLSRGCRLTLCTICRLCILILYKCLVHDELLQTTVVPLGAPEAVEATPGRIQNPREHGMMCGCGGSDVRTRVKG